MADFVELERKNKRLRKLVWKQYEIYKMELDDLKHSHESISRELSYERQKTAQQVGTLQEKLENLEKLVNKCEKSKIANSINLLSSVSTKSGRKERLKRLEAETEELNAQTDRILRENLYPRRVVTSYVPETNQVFVPTYLDTKILQKERTELSEEEDAKSTSHISEKEYNYEEQPIPLSPIYSARDDNVPPNEDEVEKMYQDASSEHETLEVAKPEIPMLSIQNTTFNPDPFSDETLKTSNPLDLNEGEINSDRFQMIKNAVLSSRQSTSSNSGPLSVTIPIHAKKESNPQINQKDPSLTEKNAAPGPAQSPVADDSFSFPDTIDEKANLKQEPAQAPAAQKLNTSSDDDFDIDFNFEDDN